MDFLGCEYYQNTDLLFYRIQKYSDCKERSHCSNAKQRADGFNQYGLPILRSMRGSRRRYCLFLSLSFEPLLSFKFALTCKLLKQSRKLLIEFFAAVGLVKLHRAVKQFAFINLQQIGNSVNVFVSHFGT